MPETKKLFGESSTHYGGKGFVPADETKDTGDFNVYEAVDVLLRRRWLMLITWIVVFALGMAYTFTRKPIYGSSAKLVVVQSKAGGGQDDPLLANLGQLTQGRNVATQVQILDSPELLASAFKKISTEDQKVGFGSKGVPSWAYKIDNTPETDIININTLAYKPKLAAELANVIAQTYLDQDQERNKASTRQARAYVEEEMNRSRQRVADATRASADIKRKTGLGAPDAQVKGLTDRMFALQSIFDQTKSQLVASTNRLGKLEAQLREQKAFIPFTTTIRQNPDFAQIAARLNTLQGQRIDLLQEFKADSPEVRQVTEAIALEKKRLASTTNNVVDSQVKQDNPVRETLYGAWATEVANNAALVGQMRLATDGYDAAKKDLANLPTKQGLVAQRDQELAVLNNTYHQLSTRYYELLINEHSSLPNGFIASHAGPASEPNSPRVNFNAIVFAILGLGIAIGAALIVERADTRLHDPQNIERITGLTTLSAIPDETGGTGRPIIGHESRTGHSFLESYRILRNNVSYASPDSELKLLSVASAGRGEGKTTTAANLAIAFAMDGKRVCLVDCDLRRPSVHEAFGLSREVGFTTVAFGRATIQEALQATEYENVWCLTSGPLPPNPSEFLNSKHSRNLLEEIATMYDLVVVDGPPCAGLSDSQIISSIVDGVILVATLNITEKPQLQATMRSLTQASAKMLGCVLNRVDLGRPGYGYYYSRYYYYGYSEEDRTTSKKRK